MPSLKDLRNRIAVTKATQKITKAMQMVAASIGAGVLCVSSIAHAADLGCSADQCVQRINEALGKANQRLIVSKQTCKQIEGRDLVRCYYRGSMGPGLFLVTKMGSENAGAVLIVDQRGLSPAGGVCISAIMEALDRSLNADARRVLYNQLLAEFAASFEKGGRILKNSRELKYLLATDDKATIFEAAHVD